MKWEDKPQTRLTLRLPKDLHGQLKKKMDRESKKNVLGISFNDYIIKILMRSLDQNIPL